jgi:phosphatidylinositol alpha-1,6-mannosyltransferase
MTILLISFEFPPQPGGIGTYSYQIAKNLHHLGNQVTALVHTNSMIDSEIEKFDSNQEFDIIRFNNYKSKVLKIIHRLVYSLKLLKTKKCQLIFIPYSHAGIIGIIGKYLFKTPYVMMGHGSEFLYKNIILKFFIRLFFNHANLILSNSNFTADLIKDAKITNPNIRVIPLGADNQVYDKSKFDSKRLKHKYGYENNKILLTVGNLSIRKGHRYVIEAVRILKDEFPDILYLIIGKGKEQERLKSLIKKYNLEEHVKLLGFIANEKLPEYYALCDLFILNSTIAPNGDIEGFGIVLVESGLMGKPVIGTRGCGITEVIDDCKTGILIDMDNYQQTAEAIKSLLSDELFMKRMGENFYLKASKILTWKAVAEKTNTEIKSIIHNYS